jgi:hypothetical protein
MKIELTTGNHPIHDKKYIIETDAIVAFWDELKDIVTSNTTTVGYQHTLIFLLAVERGQPARLEITRSNYIKTQGIRENLWGDIVWKIYDILKPVKL